jgi:hypothetical protein
LEAVEVLLIEHPEFPFQRAGGDGGLGEERLHIARLWLLGLHAPTPFLGLDSLCETLAAEAQIAGMMPPR